MDLGKFYNITVRGGKPKKGLPYDRFYRVKYLGEDDEYFKFLIDAGKVRYQITKEIVTEINPAKNFK